MQIASSANFTCRLFRSASEYTATVRIPISLHALITRSAISPRLAIRTLRNIQSLFLLSAIRSTNSRYVKNSAAGSTRASITIESQNVNGSRCQPTSTANNTVHTHVITNLLGFRDASLRCITHLSHKRLPLPYSLFTTHYSLLLLDRKQRLPVLHRLTGVHIDLHNLAGEIALNLVHQLHRLDDAQHLAVRHPVSESHKRVRIRRRRCIERSHNRRLHNMRSRLRPSLHRRSSSRSSNGGRSRQRRGNRHRSLRGNGRSARTLRGNRTRQMR